MPEVISVSFSLKRGGAAIAARKFIDLITGNQGNSSVASINQDEAGHVQFIKRLISYILGKLQFDSNPIKHSLNLFSYRPLLRLLKQKNQAIHHFHWINNDTLSIFDLNKIPPGSIITLHDEWLYCGAEHIYRPGDNDLDFVHGYPLFKKGVYGIHWSYFIWKIKKRQLSGRNDVIFTVPSHWMMERSRASMILKNGDIRYLPNPIDTNLFSPAEETRKSACKIGLGCDPEDFIFIFGAIGGKNNYYKGANILDEALRFLNTWLNNHELQHVKLIDFGGKKSGDAIRNGFKNISLGHIRDPNELALLYSVADAIVVPSMVESFGQVAAEASACGTPVICFDTSGLRDIVLDGQTGFHAECFSPHSLAKKLHEMMKLSGSDRKEMGERARNHIVSNFSCTVVSRQYLKILEDAKKMKNASSK